MTPEQMKSDIDFLARRASRAGGLYCSKDRDWGISSNSLVGLAYGVAEQAMPSDWNDYAACVRAVRHLPRHRRTPEIMQALKRAKAVVMEKWG